LKIHIKESSLKGADVIIIFSSANVPLGKFTGSNLFGDEWNRVYINTEDNDWYLRGMNGDLGIDDIDSLSIYISSIVKKLVGNSTGCKTVFFGSSMGAFGALLYGLKCNADYIIAFGAEITLGRKGGFFERECKVQNELVNVKPELQKLINDNERSQIHLFSGENNSLDTLFLAELNDSKKLKRYSVINAEHVVVKELQIDVGIKNLIEDIVYDKKDLINQVSNGFLFNFPDIAKALYLFDYQSKDSSDLRSILSAHNLPNHIKSYVYRRLALSSEKDKDHYSMAAYNLNKVCGKNAIIYARTLIKMKKYKEALYILRPIAETASIDIGKPFFQAFTLLLDAAKILKNDNVYQYYFFRALEVLKDNENLQNKLIKKYGK